MVAAPHRPAQLSARFEAQPGAPVPTDVEEGAERAAGVPDQQHALPADSHGPECAGADQLPAEGRGEPTGLEDPFLFRAEQCRVGIETPGQGAPGDVLAVQRVARVSGRRGHATSTPEISGAHLVDSEDRDWHVRRHADPLADGHVGQGGHRNHDYPRVLHIEKLIV